MVYGLTGGTGSGKTLVSEYLTELGYRVIDADKISRELTEKGSPVLDELREGFGPGIFSDDGELLRKELGKIVFSDEIQLEKLNSIMAKHLDARFVETLNRARIEDPYGKIFFDAPTLLESGREWLVDRIWVVVSDPETRIRRLMSRDGLTKDQVLARMANQLPDEKKIERADVVIYNNGTIEELKEQINNILGLN